MHTTHGISELLSLGRLVCQTVPNGEGSLSPKATLVFKKEKHHILGHVGCRKKEPFQTKSFERSKKATKMIRSDDKLLKALEGKCLVLRWS
jgi:hypothetical protein